MSFCHAAGRVFRNASKRRLLLEKLDSRVVLDGAGALTPELASVEMEGVDSQCIVGGAEYGAGAAAESTASSFITRPSQRPEIAFTHPIPGMPWNPVYTWIDDDGNVVVVPVGNENITPIPVSFEPNGDVKSAIQPGDPVTVEPTPEWKPIPIGIVLIDPTIPPRPVNYPEIQPGAPVTVEPTPEWKPIPIGIVLIDPTIPPRPVNYPEIQPGAPVTVEPAPEWRPSPIGIVLIDPTLPRHPGKDPSIQPGATVTVEPALEWNPMLIDTVIVENLSAPDLFDWSIFFASGAKKKISPR